MIAREDRDRFGDQGRKGLMITALSGIDVAWSDLECKYFEAPVHVLMGAALRMGVRAYATAPTGGARPMRRAVLTAPIESDAGIVVPEAVGLGIASDRGALERFRKTPDRC